MQNGTVSLSGKSKPIITKLLESEPLYRKVEIDEWFHHPLTLNDFPFQFHCKIDGGMRTFKLSLQPAKALESLGGANQHTSLNPFSSDTRLEFFHLYTGICQTCKIEHVHFLLNVFSEGEVHRNLIEPNIFGLSTTGAGYEKLREEYKGKLFMRKVGQWPAFQIKPEKTLFNFLDEEDRDYYNKALICLSQSYGVAAFAYLRKIVEKEIVRIVEALTKEGSGNTEEIVKLLTEYKAKKQVAPLVENIFPFLPSSLKTIGDNPLKLLYGYLSDGIHNLNDEECLLRATAIDKLLQYTIKKLKEDQTELRDIREAIKNIKSL